MLGPIHKRLSRHQSAAHMGILMSVIATLCTRPEVAYLLLHEAALAQRREECHQHVTVHWSLRLIRRQSRENRHAFSNLYDRVER